MYMSIVPCGRFLDIYKLVLAVPVGIIPHPHVVMVLLSLRDILFLCLCGTLHLINRYRKKPVAPLPPTLPGWPIIGNALQIPLTGAHLFYKELGQRLGKVNVFCD